MDTVSEHQVEQAPRRRWFVSTWVVAGLLVLVAILCNWPAYFVYETSFSGDQFGPGFYGLNHHLERGLPLSFMSQDGSRPAVRMIAEPVSLWSFWEQILRFDAFALLVDLGFWIVLSIAITAVYQAWRSRRRAIWQLSLRDCLGLCVFLGIVMAWFANEIHVSSKERQILTQIAELERSKGITRGGTDKDVGWLIDRLPSGPAWIRELVGERWFTWRGRVCGIEVSGGCLQLASQFSSLRRITMWNCAIRVDELRHIAQMRSLRAVDARYCSVSTYGDSEDGWKLTDEERERDEYEGTAKLCELLAALPDFEAIDLNEQSVDDNCLEKLAAAKNLRLLSASETDVTDQGLRHLAHLKRLEVLDLYLTKITDAGLIHLSGLTELRELNLRSEGIKGRGLKHLAGLKKLEHLSLPSGVDTAAVSRLRAALPNADIYCDR